MRRAEELTRSEPMPPMEEAPEWLKEALPRWGVESRQPTSEVFK